MVDGDRLIAQAIKEWIPAAAEEGPGQVVMIARDNDTRAHLNEAARAHRAQTGELGGERSYGTTMVAVGDRVICRHNDAWVGVDNGTRGTVRHVAGDRAVLETDSGAVRDLPAGYVADHVEHAYCLTGHGMQGGTVERAFVVAAAEDLTRGWSYSALSRARGMTRLLIGDQDRRDADRAEVAPHADQPNPVRSEVLARAARRMLVRDDEDLAVDQIAAAGREDDRALTSDRTATGSVPQELAAERAEPMAAEPSRSRLMELRDELSRLRLGLSALPTKPLARFDELDAQARDLVAQRGQRQESLAGLQPPGRRRGRVRDPDAGQRAFLQTAIDLDTHALAQIHAERTRLERELGDPDQIRSERDGLTHRIQDLRREHDEIRDQLTRQTIDRQPRWLTDALGARPDRARDIETWDRAAQRITQFRLNRDVVDHATPLGPPPTDPQHRRDWDEASAGLERAQRQLGREPTLHDHGIDHSIG